MSMRVPRIYQPTSLQKDMTLALDEDGAAHIGRVLRMQVDEQICLFNGDGNDYLGQILQITKKQVQVKIISVLEVLTESPLHLHLGQVISRGERMEFTIQKSVELGVNIITPLISVRCGVKLAQNRLEKKLHQWQKIAISACEQSGRSKVPEIRPTMMLQDWCSETFDGLKLNLDPRANGGISQLDKANKAIRLLIGPEGGLSSAEISMTQGHNFTSVLLGPRVLRTETASLCAISALQMHFGDLG